jgi:hypothetical protein
MVVLVIVVDVIGGVSLAYALTHSSHGPQTAHAPTAAEVAHPQDPLTQPVAAPTTPPSARLSTVPPRPRHRHRPRPASLPGDAQPSFAALAAREPGQIGAAIAPLGRGPVDTFGSLQVGHAWSTMKVPVLTTLLADLESQGRVLDAPSRENATLALEQSDNAAAEALFSELEQSHGGLVGASLAVQQTLRRARDGSVQVNTAPNTGGFTTWGQSEWSAAGEVAFYRSLAHGCLLSGPDTSYVLSLMGNVTSDQRWGAGSVDFGAPVAFKGGWGPESGGGYLVRQTAIVGSGDHGYVFSMLALPQDGSFASGTAMLDQIAAWIARTFNANVSTPPASCS